MLTTFRCSSLPRNGFFPKLQIRSKAPAKQAGRLQPSSDPSGNITRIINHNKALGFQWAKVPPYSLTPSPCTTRQKCYLVNASRLTFWASHFFLPLKDHWVKRKIILVPQHSPVSQLCGPKPADPFGNTRRSGGWETLRYLPTFFIVSGFVVFFVFTPFHLWKSLLTSQMGMSW